MFRAKQYALCGGYRPEFYFGQDWDLWFRLAALGTFCTLQKRLCVSSITLNSISASRREEQERFARLSHKAWLARQAGLSDLSVLEEARQLLSSIEKRPKQRRDRAAANYFIGKCLIDQNDKAAWGYLLAAVKEHPLHFGGWINLARLLFA
jgi:hypothetical protein